jgi:hypothetical protein|tara:strand:- start:95 stop:475 length:381 start_codon:yes stop_codon:yes gene_type:complete
MVADAQFKGMQVPGAKYDQLSGLYKCKPKPFELKILPDKDRHINKYKIKKSKAPDMGSYNSFKSFRNTQLHGFETKMHIGKSPNKNFIDHAVKSKKANLAPGHYKDVEKCYARLSTSPVGIRMKRH